MRLSTSWLTSLAPFLATSKLLKAARKQLILPFYHAVSDASLPHISPLYAVKTAAQFEADLDFFLRHATPIDLPTVYAHVLGTAPLKQPSFHLTFDDGLREVYDIAFPILQRKGVPATLFVNPSFVDNRALFYRYKVALLVQRIQAWPHRNFPQLVQFPHITHKQELINVLLKATYAQAGLLDQIAKTLDVDFEQFLQTQKPYLYLAELQALAQKGVAIGAHSLDHPYYSTITLDEQLRQTTESMAWVKRHLQPPVQAFAFPFTDHGVSNAFFDQLSQHPHAPALLFGTAKFNIEPRSHHLQRLPMETTLLPTEQYFQTELAKYIIKSTLGFHFVPRK